MDFKKIAKKNVKEFIQSVDQFHSYAGNLLHLLKSVKLSLKNNETCFNIMEVQSNVETLNTFMVNMNRFYDRVEFIEELQFEKDFQK
jgi:hypothetical protein